MVGATYRRAQAARRRSSRSRAISFVGRERRREPVRAGAAYSSLDRCPFGCMGMPASLASARLAIFS